MYGADYGRMVFSVPFLSQKQRRWEVGNGIGLCLMGMGSVEWGRHAGEDGWFLGLVEWIWNVWIWVLVQGKFGLVITNLR